LAPTPTPNPAPDTHTVNVPSNGSFDQTSLTPTTGDSIVFRLPTGYEDDEISIRFSPTTISSLKLDHDVAQGTRTFNSAGIWTVSVLNKNGNTLNISVQ
jgi:hypothetical protein